MKIKVESAFVEGKLFRQSSFNLHSLGANLSMQLKMIGLEIEKKYLN
jgi:hypothetical protein